MTDHQSSYRQIIKATSLFGGVQVFNIIILLIRSKFIAVLLGPVGMGIAGLLTTTAGLVSGLTNFGLGTSAVRDVVAANAVGNQTQLNIVITVLRRLVWITGTLGMLVMLVLSPWLSELSFGNHNYTWAFAWISVTLLFSQLSVGRLTVLQGMRKLKYLAKASLLGNALGLVVTVPLYYWYGIDAIVPAIIIASIVSLLLSFYFSRKIKIDKVKLSGIKTIAEGKNMLTMGFMISLSGMISFVASYIVCIFISNTGGVGEVGLYNAGFVIINSYVSLIFTSMATDYYPRLSNIAHSNELCKQAINQQAEIALLILFPIIIIFLVFIQWVVILLYSNMFIKIDDMIHWAAIGMFFKAASWSVAFIFISKGDSKTFIFSELAANVYMLFFNIIGYYYFGLKGIGISYFISYLLYLIQVFWIARVKYDFSFEPVFYRIFGKQFFIAIICFVIVKTVDKPYSYFIGIILIIISVWYSYKELDKRLGIKTIIVSFKDKHFRK